LGNVGEGNGGGSGTGMLARAEGNAGWIDKLLVSEGFDDNGVCGAVCRRGVCGKMEGRRREI